MTKKKNTSKPKRPARDQNQAPFWVLDTCMEGLSEETLSAVGPFGSVAHAEAFILNTSAQDWLTSCGCLRSGDPQTWGREHLIVKVVRRVVPVPPDHVEMTLQEVQS